MSTTLPADKKLPVAVAGTAVIVVAAFATIGYLAAGRIDAVDEPSVAPAPVVSPTVRHAPWRISVKTIGRPATKGGRREVELRRGEVRRHVRAMYDALFEARSGVDEVARRFFAPPAAERFARSLRGLARVGTIKILKRRALLAVSADDLRHATASVRHRLRADIAQKKVRFLHRATLWLERADATWRVIAFSVDESPLR